MPRIVHVSDVHLSPLPAIKWRELFNKRLTGYANWRAGRHRVHQGQVLERLMADARTQQPDHYAVTGDLINLALPDEFTQAAGWLRQLGAPEQVSLVPGNHDAYVIRTPGKPMMCQWAEYMQGDGAAAMIGHHSAHQFPYIRVRGRIAIIGISTAHPTAPFIAAGWVGRRQLMDLARILQLLGRRQLFRIVLLHHPVLPIRQNWRRGLRDGATVRQVLEQAGAELVLHGHTHVFQEHYLSGRRRQIPVIGVASASMAQPHHGQLASYNLFDIEDSGENWQIHMQRRGLVAEGGRVDILEDRIL